MSNGQINPELRLKALRNQLNSQPDSKAFMLSRPTLNAIIKWMEERKKVIAENELLREQNKKLRKDNNEMLRKIRQYQGGI